MSQHDQILCAILGAAILVFQGLNRVAIAINELKAEIVKKTLIS